MAAAAAAVRRPNAPPEISHADVPGALPTRRRSPSIRGHRSRHLHLEVEYLRDNLPDDQRDAMDLGMLALDLTSPLFFYS
jgi:hypothetical protein